MELTPTKDEVGKWMLDTVRHVCHIEYFLNRLNLGGSDPERPHDLVGLGNKFDWDVIKGFALQYRTPKPDFQTYVMPALTLHRQQYHHRMWNNPDPNEPVRPVPEATIEDMLVGAVDTNCSLLESRGYQGGTHDYREITEVAVNNPPHKTPWMLALIHMMERVEQPCLDMITDVHHIPNIGFPGQIHVDINNRTREALKMLKSDHGYDI